VETRGVWFRKGNAKRRTAREKHGRERLRKGKARRVRVAKGKGKEKHLTWP